MTISTDKEREQLVEQIALSLEGVSDRRQSIRWSEALANADRVLDAIKEAGALVLMPQGPVTESGHYWWNVWIKHTGKFNARTPINLIDGIGTDVADESVYINVLEDYAES